MRFSPLFLSVASALSVNVQAEDIEVIQVRAKAFGGMQLAQANAEQAPSTADTADWLRQLPGANVNKNGAVSGIAQYRGLFGDRVNVNIDGAKLTGAGPNAMDAPLSYAPSLLTESVAMSRGIAPVSWGVDTLGGSVKVVTRRALVEDGHYGLAQAGYQSQGEGLALSGLGHVASGKHALMLFASHEEGDDREDGEGREIVSSGYQKRIARLDYQFAAENYWLGVQATHHDTQDAGTPALAMDIDYIRSDRVLFDGGLTLNMGELNWQLSWMDGEHGMDNFQHRSVMSAMAQRYNTARSRSWTAHLDWQWLGWELGTDLLDSRHDSTITNPGNAMFEVLNFNQVQEQRLSAYAQWQGDWRGINTQIGTRVKHIQSDAGDVSHHMAMMNAGVANLMNRFNASNREVSETLVDVSVNLNAPLTESWSWSAGLGYKTRPASYQEKYLWVPMKATGGLADGKTYIGDANLDAEKALQFELGLGYQSKVAHFTPRIFWQDISDYIDGTPVADMSVQMLANMMMGDPSPLQFTNVDARLYGIDLGWGVTLSDNWRLDGQLSLVRGERTDIDEDLYRLSPLRANTRLSYHHANWQTSLMLDYVDAQTRVSDLHQERTSHSYALLHWHLDYQVSEQLALHAGVDNLFDRFYRDHLAGVYRVSGEEIAQGEKIPGVGRNAYIRMSYQF